MLRFWGLGFRGFMFISNLANRPRNLAGTKEMKSESGGLSTGSDLTLDGSRSDNYVKQGLLAANYSKGSKCQNKKCFGPKALPGNPCGPISLYLSIGP